MSSPQTFEFYLKQNGVESLFDYRTRRVFVNKIVAAINCSNDQQSHCNKLVLEILGYHEHMKKVHKGCCQVKTFHNCLYVGTKLCVAFRLNNTSTVCMLLEAVTACELGFWRFMNTLFLHEKTNIFYSNNWRNDCDPEEVDLAAIEYFLHHSNKAKQVYSLPSSKIYQVEKPSARFVDMLSLGIGVPMFCAAAHNNKSHAILLLLRYGATLTLKQLPHGVYPSIVRLVKLITIYATAYNIETIAPITTCTFNKNIWHIYDGTDKQGTYVTYYFARVDDLYHQIKVSSVPTFQDEQENHTINMFIIPAAIYIGEIQDEGDDDINGYEFHVPRWQWHEKQEVNVKGYSPALITCLKYYLRVVPNLNIQKFDCTLEDKAQYLNDQCNIKILSPGLLDDNIIPRNRFCEPAELQHLCRCMIRKRLYDNWQLPDGIVLLPVPKIIQHYLDLQAD